MTCGVYSFNCGPYFYVGRSINIEVRWKEHLRRLKNGTHTNPWVQNAFDKHGWTGQDILVECEPHQNKENEQHFIDLFQGTEFCMNLSNSAEDGGSGMVQVRWARPGSREAASVVQKEVQNRPEVKANHRAGTKARFAQPGARQAASAVMGVVRNLPSVKLNTSIASKRAWQERKIRDFEAELADIPEGGDIISMFEVKNEEP